MDLDSRLGQPRSIDCTFGLAMREEVHCSACGKTTQQCSYTQYFYNTQARRRVRLGASVQTDAATSNQLLGHLQMAVACCTTARTFRVCSVRPPLQATGLRLLGLAGASTGALLRHLEAQHLKSCDEDMAGELWECERLRRAFHPLNCVCC